MGKDKNYDNKVHEEQADYKGFVHISEDEKLKRDIYRAPLEKLHLFTQMLKRESTLKKAKVFKPD